MTYRLVATAAAGLLATWQGFYSESEATQMKMGLLEDDNRAGWLFGYVLLIGLFGFAFASGYGNFQQATSFGLKDVLDIIKSLLTFWAGWKFSRGPFMPPPETAPPPAVKLADAAPPSEESPKEK